MTSSIENRLAQALHEAAEQVPAGAVPPLRLPHAGSANGTALAGRAERRRGAGGRPGTAGDRPGIAGGFLSGRLLAPLAAAASVLAIAAGVTAVAGIGRDGGSAQTASAAAPHGVPRYYIALTAATGASASSERAAGIFATATGELMASIAAPEPYRTVVGVSAASDDRTFALAVAASTTHDHRGVAIYVASFRPARQTAKLTGPPVAAVPAGASLDGFALSPDARKLAFAYQLGAGGAGLTEVLKVVDIATHTVRTWTSAHGTITGAGLEPRSLNWADDSATLAFAWYGFRKGARGTSISDTTGVRLLQTRLPGSDLLANSRRCVRLYHVGTRSAPAGLVPQAAMLSGDGKVVVAAVTSRSGTAGGFAEFSATTGALVRKLGWRSLPTGASAKFMRVLWSNRSGSTLVVGSPPGHPGQIGILRAGRFMLLPGPANGPLIAAW